MVLLPFTLVDGPGLSESVFWEESVESSESGFGAMVFQDKPHQGQECTVMVPTPMFGAILRLISHCA